MKNEKLFIPMLLISYGCLFFSIDLFLTGEATLRKSNLVDGYFIYLKGNDAYIYAASFFVISIFLFFYFYLTSKKILFKNNVVKTKIEFVKKVWIFNFFLILVLTILINIINKHIISIFLLVLVLCALIYAAYVTYEINKVILKKET